PNLTIARLHIDSDTISKLPYFLSSCINLKYLKILGPRNQETNVNNIFREISLIKLANNNLEVLGIHACWTFTPENLELFLGYFTRLKKFELLWSSCVCNEHFKVLLNRFWYGGVDRRDYDDDENDSYQRSFKKRDNRKYNNRFWNKRYIINNESFGKNNGKVVAEIEVITKYMAAVVEEKKLKVVMVEEDFEEDMSSQNNTIIIDAEELEKRKKRAARFGNYLDPNQLASTQDWFIEKSQPINLKDLGYWDKLFSLFDVVKIEEDDYQRQLSFLDDEPVQRLQEL
ncbi:19957_t:CDS:2, partial [Dentiscutata erythropus]